MKRRIGIVISVVLIINLLGGAIASASIRNDGVPYGKYDRIAKINQQIKKKIRKSNSDKKYSEYDINKDGVVDIKDLEIVKNTIENNKYHPKCDFNKDKVVDKTDYYLLKDNFTPVVTPVPTPVPVQLYYDLNGDGIVDEKDLTMVYMAIKYQKYDPVCDVNKDGVVDDRDYYLVKENLTPVIVTPVPTPTPRPVDLQYDLNGDGYVDKDDLTLVYLAIKEPYNPKFDFNGDGVIDNADCDIFYYAAFGG